MKFFINIHCLGTYDVEYINIYYLPDGTSVLEKYFVEVSKI